MAFHAIIANDNHFFHLFTTLRVKQTFHFNLVLFRYIQIPNINKQSNGE